MKIATVYASSSDERPNWTVTAAMSPKADAFTPSTNVLAHVELRMFEIKGFELEPIASVPHSADGR
jgi:hypothetical protein